MITIQSAATVIRVMDGDSCVAEASRHGAYWGCTARGEGTVWVVGRHDADAWIHKVYLAAGGAP